MMACVERGGGKPAIYRIVMSALLVVALAGSRAVADAPRPDQTLNIVLDQARLVKLPDRVATIVIGNPLIADVSLQAGGLMVITGKGYGTTNLIALDRSGNSLLEKNVLVHGPRGDVVTVYRGIERETYSCAPKCEPRITPGDSQNYFNRALAQTTVRNSQAAAMGK